MDGEIMKIWIHKAWRSLIRGLGRQRSFLVFDSLEAHKTEEMKRLLKMETLI